MIAATLRSCADCGTAFEAPHAKFCPDCRYKPANRAGAKRRKYEWTPERDEVLRRRYDSTIRRRAAEIAKSLGWPDWVVKKRARQLGLGAPWPKERTGRLTWSEAETAFLLEHTGARTALWIAKRLGKSETSVILKIKRMGLSRRVDDGSFTARQVAEGFGIDSHAVSRWIERGWLKATKRGSNLPHDAYRVRPDDVRSFIRENPLRFDIRKVDQVWFLDLLGVISGEAA